LRLILSDATGSATFDPDTDGGEDSCILTIFIGQEKPVTGHFSILRNQTSNLLGRSAEAKVARANWLKQFENALKVSGGDDDDDDGGEDEEKGGPSTLDWILHIITLPWKLLFALVPPPDYCGGWSCFVVSLLFIAALTALVEDTAKIFGCCWGIPDAVIAITAVAMGTSLPDTFASQIAAVQSPEADSAVGNITGSNCVNVFLGLGIPWSFSALYWMIHGRDADWDALYYSDATIPQRFRDTGAFIVHAGDLGVSVAIYVATAMFTLSLMAWRRRSVGCELGGGTALTQRLYASGFFTMWAVYVIACVCYICINET